MATLQSLIAICRVEPDKLWQQAEQEIALWEKWLQPVSDEMPTGEDPTYDDDFQRIRDEVNKLSGADTEQVCMLAEKLLTTSSKDIRIVTYYIWARLHQHGEAGLAEGLALLAGMMQRCGAQLHPQRQRSRQAALEWLAGQRMLDSLLLYPEVEKQGLIKIIGALQVIEHLCQHDNSNTAPNLGALYHALETRLEKSGGPDAIIPQNIHSSSEYLHTEVSNTPVLSSITSGRDLLEQARILSSYLRDQPHGWLAAHRLMKCIRHDTLHQLPPLSVEGRSRIEPPKPDQRALLKRLYIQQSWSELLEQADALFTRGACHLWLDLQWYIHQALLRSPAPYDSWAEIVVSDLRNLLTRITGLESLAFNDGTPFADEVTLNWINQQVLDLLPGQQDLSVASVPDNTGNDDIMQLESEALSLADTEGPEMAFNWLQQRPAIHSPRQHWLITLLMARVAEQYGRNEAALHLLEQLDNRADTLTLPQWEPALVFEVKARRLKLLRMKASRNETEKLRLQPQTEQLLSGLIRLDPSRAMILCGDKG